MAQGQTLFEKVWNRHVVADYGDGFALMHIDRLIVPDLSSRALSALRERGLYPINHLVVVKDELLAAHPGLAADLFAAYAAAKNRYTAALASGTVTDPDPADRMYQRVAQLTGADPLPYGIAPNRAMIDQLIRYAVDQRILGKTVAAEEIFELDIA